MSSKHVVFIIALSAALISCGSDAPPEVNATNCSGAGMQAALPTFTNEIARQAFIDNCEAMMKK